jgi:hypothetical protein
MRFVLYELRAFHHSAPEMKSLSLAGFLAGLLISVSAFVGTARGGIDEKDYVKEVPPAPSALEFRIGLPGFLSALSGDFGVKGVVTDLDLSIEKVVRHINEFPVALSVSARYHRWEFFADGEWIQLGVTTNLRDLLFTQADLQMGYAFWEGFIGYRLVDGDKAVVSLYAGARYSYYSADFTITKSTDPRYPLFRELLGIPLNGQASGDRSWVDPVVGIGGRWRVAKAVTLYANGDLGGFDVNSGSAFEAVQTPNGLTRASTSSSDWSYQVQGGVEVQWARHLYTQLGWRYLKYDYRIEGFVNKTELNGPFIQAGVNF